MISLLRKDLERYVGNMKPNIKTIFYLLFAQEVWAVTIYRFGSWVHHHCKIPVVRLLLKLIAFLLFKMNETILGITIPFSVEIGEGFYIGHFGRIIINTKVKLEKIAR